MFAFAATLGRIRARSTAENYSFGGAHCRSLTKFSAGTSLCLCSLDRVEKLCLDTADYNEMIELQSQPADHVKSQYRSYMIPLFPATLN